MGGIKMNERSMIKRYNPAGRGLILGLGAAILAFSLSSCDRTRNDKGYEYFPDMAHSQSFETYAPNPNFDDGTTNQGPVAGAVSRETLPFDYPANIDGRILAGKEVLNPLERKPEVVSRGAEQYKVFCMMCHGEKGDGMGYLHTDKLYNFKPASLVNERVRTIPDGEIFHSITLGFGVMGAHGAQLNRDDRWSIIHYIRQELQK
jgi:mono/diheme cytochrome c family protein